MHVGQAAGPSRKGKSARRSRANEEIALQITSMADIFTILLVFLLKSYSVSAVNVNVGKDVKLPTARGGNESVEAMKVEVTSGGVTVEGQPVVQLNNFEASAKDLSQNGTFPAVVKALEKEREKQKVIENAQNAQGAPAPDAQKKEKDSKLLVIADKNMPYKLLKQVLASAAMQEYTDFKLVVVTQD